MHSFIPNPEHAIAFVPVSYYSMATSETLEWAKDFKVLCKCGWESGIGLRTIGGALKAFNDHL